MALSPKGDGVTLRRSRLVWSGCGGAERSRFPVVRIAFGRAEPTHAAMRLRHEWGTRLVGWDSE